jgi:hypothetical protein
MRSRHFLTIRPPGATNVVTNGNFANGTTGWTSLASISSVLNNTLTNTCNGTANYGLIDHNGVAIIGRKYFVRARVRVNNANCIRVAINRPEGAGTVQITTPVQNQWYIISGVVTADQAVINRVVHIYLDTTTANGKVMEVQEVLTIDMTAHGLEGLTAQQMNDRYPNWFDGTISSSLSRKVW